MRAQTKLIALGAVFMVLLGSIIIMALIDDVEGPLIYEVDILPVSPKAGDMIAVIIYCIDSSGVSGAQLSSSVNDEEWVVEDMKFYACLCLAGGRWTAAFGPLNEGDVGRFFVTSFDNSPFENAAETQIYEIVIEA